MIEPRTKSGFRDAHFLAYTALLIAVGVLLPMIFHQMGIAGKVFLPMHFPVIIAGFLFGPLSGVLVGCFSPVLSFLLTGMPPFPTVLAMVPELMTYGAVSGWLYRGVRASVCISWLSAMVGRLIGRQPEAIWRWASVYVSLLSTMIAGRIVYGLALWPMIPIMGFDPGSQKTIFGLVIFGVATGLPGIIGQLVLIPLLVRGIRRAR